MTYKLQMSPFRYANLTSNVHPAHQWRENLILRNWKNAPCRSLIFNTLLFFFFFSEDNKCNIPRLDIFCLLYLWNINLPSPAEPFFRFKQGFSQCWSSKNGAYPPVCLDKKHTHIYPHYKKNMTSAFSWIEFHCSTKDMNALIWSSIWTDRLLPETQAHFIYLEERKRRQFTEAVVTLSNEIPPGVTFPTSRFIYFGFGQFLWSRFGKERSGGTVKPHLSSEHVLCSNDEAAIWDH